MDLRELPSKSFSRHPWEAVRADFFTSLVSGQLDRHRPASVLDFGAGDGYFSRRLIDALGAGSRITCFDSNYTAAQIEQMSSGAHEHVRFESSLDDTVFDCLVFLDVLEHVADDVAALANVVRRNLRPGGSVIISVPAWPLLYTQHDVHLGHHRRYRRKELTELVRAAGLRSLRRGYLFSSLLLPRLGSKLGEVVRGVHSRPEEQQSTYCGAADIAEWRWGRAVTRCVNAALTIDHRTAHALSRLGIVLPGLSIWSLAQKSDETP